MRIVLDTSVLISAIRSESGGAAEIVRLALTGKITLLMDLKIASEYRDVALRAAHVRASGKSRRQVERLVQLLEEVAEAVRVAFKHRPLSQDVGDDMILDVAINGRAAAIVTNNVKHFADVAAAFGIRALGPKDFLDFYRKKGVSDGST